MSLEKEGRVIAGFSSCLLSEQAQLLDSLHLGCLKASPLDILVLYLIAADGALSAAINI